MRGACIGVLMTVVFAAGSAAQVPPTINLRLPSDAAGGGNLAVRLAIPPQSVGPRYPEGAPMLVFVPGGQSVGALAAGASYAQQGFVVVTFLFPGGTEGGFHSDGVYDYRGAGCIAALRDVLLFAGGRKSDILGRSIGQLLPFASLTGAVGMLGSSNGGPISMAVLGTYGAQLDFVATYVGWENPTNSQTVLAEAGGKFYDCDAGVDGDGNGIPNDDGKNPYLTSYGASHLGMDFTRLAWDSTVAWTATDPAGLHAPAACTGALFLDGNGNGVVDVSPGNPSCYDLNGDGHLDIGEDYVFKPLASYETGALRIYYSIDATGEAEARGVFGATWPQSVATAAQSQEYWALRDATLYYEPLAAVRPDLRCMLVFAAADHVQASDEHLHVQQAYDGLRNGGLWCRLNPDDSYYRLVDPAPSRPPQDNDANLPVAWPAMADYDEEYPLSSNVATLAAILEMADRARAGNWMPNLGGTISDAWHGPQSAGLLLRVTPHPVGSRSMIAWRGAEPAPATLHLYDVAGRLLSTRLLAVPARSGSLRFADLVERRLAAGVYCLEIQAGAARVRQRVVVLGP